MTPEQERSMTNALTEFVGKAEQKYREGQAEHGGNLWEKDGLLTEAGNEVIDQLFYLDATRKKLSCIEGRIRAVSEFIKDSPKQAMVSYEALARDLNKIADDVKNF